MKGEAVHSYQSTRKKK